MSDTTGRSHHMPGLSGWVLAAGYVGIVALPLVLAAFSGVEPFDFWTELAAATGIAGGVMMLLQLVSSGRFEILSGRIGIDVTMGFHKWTAPIALVLVLAHPLLLVGPWDDPARSMRQLWAMLNSERLRDGVAALLILLAIIGLGIFRERLPVRYEVWRASHALMALALVILTVVHARAHGIYAAEAVSGAFWIALGIAVVAPMLWVYARKPRDLMRHGWQVSAVRRLAHKLWELTLTSSTGTPLRYAAGQFAWINATHRRIPLADNPFSISSAPGDGTRLQFIIQEAGDFTDTVGDLPVGRRVALDAPHGSFTAARVEGDTILLIGGGVGIAPIVGILADLAANGETRPVRLIYAARDRASLIDPEEFAPLLAQLDARALYLVDEETEDPRLGRGPIGEAHLRDMLDGGAPARTGALLCGPGTMMVAVTDSLNDIGVPLDNIDYERFDYSDGTQSRKDRQILRRFRMTGAAILAAALVFALR